MGATAIKGLILVVVLSQFLLLQYSAQEERNQQRLDDCPIFFPCGKLGDLRFPYTQNNHSDHCGVFEVAGCKNKIQNIRFEPRGRWYNLSSVSEAETIKIYDEELEKQFKKRDCASLGNWSLPVLPYVTFNTFPNNLISLCKCPGGLNLSLAKELSHTVCHDGYTLYSDSEGMPSGPHSNASTDGLSSRCNCPIIQLPRKDLPHQNLQLKSKTNVFKLLTPSISVEVTVTRDCKRCFRHGGACQARNQRFHCSKAWKNNLGLKLKLKLGLGIGCPNLLLLILSIYVFWFRHKNKHTSTSFLGGRPSPDPSSESDPESSSAALCFGLPIFSYRELVEATNNFDSDKELGDGGFGTVYYAKLQDGREVAIKRLYQHNNRRIQLFINEVELLTRLRHKNLVSLYGCTSRRSRELLLVYEFIPNGTVADHLRGDLTQMGLLTWPIRMSIAIETASALCYLHASDIIHRDVKTNNILLDSNFSVKVADFGLSRLFPNDVTHISTAPQGTPGYVDPEYHQCYQLTEKSDVYSFGVVLIELISSLPAVDTNRHKQEINLANFAVTKIHKGAFDELIDPKLGHNSDAEVGRMAIWVAELAFRCLQQEKEMRPSMGDVLKELESIQREESNLESVLQEQRPPSPPNDDQIALLKNIHPLPPPPSPVSVADNWISESTTSTPNTSG